MIPQRKYIISATYEIIKIFSDVCTLWKNWSSLLLNKDITLSLVGVQISVVHPYICQYINDYNAAWSLVLWCCLLFHIVWCYSYMITSSNGNIFRVTGPLCGEFTGYFPSQKPAMRSFDVFFLSATGYTIE